MKSIRTLFLVAAVCCTAVGCGLREINRQSAVIESTGVLKGKVKVESDQQGRVIVARFEEKAGVFTLEARRFLSAGGEYEFIVEPGNYLVAAFIDVNNDGNFQKGEEHASYHTDPLTVLVETGETVVIDPIVISGHPPAPPSDAVVGVEETDMFWNLGSVVSLDDPGFSRDNYALGLWRPLDFLNTVDGGLLFLEPYSPSKVPVLFIHGIDGGPTDLRPLIEALDRDRYQAWILYYPSGVRLDIVSDYLVRAVTELQRRHAFEAIDIVAHSMGGLVTRSFIKKFTETYPERIPVIRLVVTINSPMLGMPSAASGVAHSPVVVSSWRDVATSSAFLEDLLEWSWPAQIPYHLVFSWEADDANDGVVSLGSQIPMKLMLEARRVYAFNNTHVGTLSDGAFIELFTMILDEYYPAGQ